MLEAASRHYHRALPLAMEIMKINNQTTIVVVAIHGRQVSCPTLIRVLYPRRFENGRMTSHTNTIAHPFLASPQRRVLSEDDPSERIAGTFAELFIIACGIISEIIRLGWIRLPGLFDRVQSKQLEIRDRDGIGKGKSRAASTLTCLFAEARAQFLKKSHDLMLMVLDSLNHQMA